MSTTHLEVAYRSFVGFPRNRLAALAGWPHIHRLTMCKLWHQERRGLMYSYRSAWAKLNVLVLDFVCWKLFQHLESIWLRHAQTENQNSASGVSSFPEASTGLQLPGWTPQMSMFNHHKREGTTSDEFLKMGNTCKTAVSMGKIKINHEILSILVSAYLFWQNPNGLCIPATSKCSVSWSRNGI